MHDKNAQGILEQLKACGDFLVIGHVSPDGDTVGSGLALCLGRTGRWANGQFLACMARCPISWPL